MAQDYSNQYNTPIPPEKQAAFNQWVATQKATGKDPLRDKFDYDVQGYWLSGGSNDQRGHGPDTFKKPNHPTFSNESKYHGMNGNYGGAWGEDNSFTPSQTNLQHNSFAQLQQYFQKVEPGTKLMQPKIDSIGNAGAPPPASMQQQTLPGAFAKFLGVK